VRVLGWGILCSLSARELSSAVSCWWAGLVSVGSMTAGACLEFVLALIRVWHLAGSRSGYEVVRVDCGGMQRLDLSERCCTHCLWAGGGSLHSLAACTFQHRLAPCVTHSSCAECAVCRARVVEPRWTVVLLHKACLWLDLASRACLTCCCMSMHCYM
jgi:hypothetical protein